MFKIADEGGLLLLTEALLSYPLPPGTTVQGQCPNANAHARTSLLVMPPGAEGVTSSASS